MDAIRDNVSDYDDAPAIRLPPLVAETRSAQLPLSLNERSTWIYNQEDPSNVYLNMKVLLFIDGDIQKDLLEKAINQTIQQHEILRTTYHQDNQHRLFRQILDNSSFTVDFYDLQSLTENEQQQQLRNLAKEREHQLFKLDRLPLFSWTLLKLSDEKHVMILCMHHIIGDGYSVGLLIKKVMQNYQHLHEDKPARISTHEKLSYADYAIWQQQAFQRKLFEPLVSYWEHKLSQASALKLPYDKPKNSLTKNHAQVLVMKIDKDKIAELMAFVTQQKTSLFVFFMAAWQLLLAEITQQQHLLIETILSNRLSAEKISMLGALATDGIALYEVNKLHTVKDFLKNLLQQTLAINTLQQDMGPMIFNSIARKLPGMPVVGINFHSHYTLQIANLQMTADASYFDKNTLPGSLDLFLEIWPRQDEIVVDMVYRTDVFVKETIENFMSFYFKIVDFFIQYPEAKLSDHHLIENK